VNPHRQRTTAGMPNVNRGALEEFTGLLPTLFYALLGVSLLALASGSPGSGLVLLVLGGCAHVVRVGTEAAVAQRGSDTYRQAQGYPPAVRARRERVRPPQGQPIVPPGTTRSSPPSAEYSYELHHVIDP
jgi:hypothetical protein